MPLLCRSFLLLGFLATALLVAKTTSEPLSSVDDEEFLIAKETANAGDDLVTSLDRYEKKGEMMTFQMHIFSESRFADDDDNVEDTMMDKRGGKGGYSHALRIRRGGSENGGYSHALRIRTSPSFHALRVKKSNSRMFNHALRVRKSGSGSPFSHALRIKKSGYMVTRGLPYSHALRVRRYDPTLEDVDDYLLMDDDNDNDFYKRASSFSHVLRVR